MDNRINLSPPPGNYLTPVATTVRLEGKAQYPEVILLEFQTILSFPGQPTRQSSIAIPLPKIEASGLLRSLKMLQDAGVIPFVPEATESKN